jgi:TonB family protein
MRRSLGLIPAALASATLAQTPAPAADPAYEWVEQTQGDLKWAHAMGRLALLDCSGAALLAAQERDPTLEAKMQTDVSGYGCYLLRLRNESAQTIQCNVHLDLPGANPKKPLPLDEGVVLAPSSESIALETFAPVTAAPRVPASTCFAVPATLPPYRSPDKKCRGAVNVPPPSYYYPPSSKARNEEGDVVLEYSVAKGSNKWSDVRVVASSGFVYLDSAALRLARDSTAEHKCPKERYRLKIAFRLQDG